MKRIDLNKDVHNLTYEQEQIPVREYTDPTSNIVQRGRFAIGDADLSPDSEWEYMDNEGHEHYWVQNPDSSYSIPNCVELDEGGSTTYYCNECDEQIFPKYLRKHPMITEGSIVSFELVKLDDFLSSQKEIKVGELIELKYGGDTSFGMVQRVSMDRPFRGHTVIKISCIIQPVDISLKLMSV